MAKYHYEYFAYTCNLNYGRMQIGHGRTRTEASIEAQWAGKGVYQIEKRRVYDN